MLVALVLLCALQSGSTEVVPEDKFTEVVPETTFDAVEQPDNVSDQAPAKPTPQLKQELSQEAATTATDACSFSRKHPDSTKMGCSNDPTSHRTANLEDCKAACGAADWCKYIVHWSNNGCQLFSSCTEAALAYDGCAMYQKGSCSNSANSLPTENRRVVLKGLRERYDDGYCHNKDACCGEAGKRKVAKESSYSTQQIELTCGLMFEDNWIGDTERPAYWDCKPTSKYWDFRQYEGAKRFKHAYIGTNTQRKAMYNTCPPTQANKRTENFYRRYGESEGTCLSESDTICEYGEGDGEKALERFTDAVGKHAMWGEGGRLFTRDNQDRKCGLEWDGQWDLGGWGFRSAKWDCKGNGDPLTIQNSEIHSNGCILTLGKVRNGFPKNNDWPKVQFDAIWDCCKDGWGCDGASWDPRADKHRHGQIEFANGRYDSTNCVGQQCPPDYGHSYALPPKYY